MRYSDEVIASIFTKDRVARLTRTVRQVYSGDDIVVLTWAL